MLRTRALPVAFTTRLLHAVESRLKALAVTTAYFDESGDHDKPVFSVAGFLSSDKRWRRFDQEWKKELRRRDVETLHMTDFETRHGEFKDKTWSNDERTAFIAQLAHIIKNTIMIGVGHAVLV